MRIARVLVVVAALGSLNTSVAGADDAPAAGPPACWVSWRPSQGSIAFENIGRNSTQMTFRLKWRAEDLFYTRCRARTAFELETKFGISEGRHHLGEPWIKSTDLPRAYIDSSRDTATHDITFGIADAEKLQPDRFYTLTYVMVGRLGTDELLSVEAARGYRLRYCPGGDSLCVAGWSDRDRYGPEERIGIYSDSVHVSQGQTLSWSYPSRSTLLNHVLRDPLAGDAHFVDRSGVRHWIETAETFNCLVGQGVSVVESFADVEMRWVINSLREGDRASCDDSGPPDLGEGQGGGSASFVPNSVVRLNDGTAYYLDGSMVRHWIPTGGVYLCFREWKSLPLYDNVERSRVSPLAEGPTATCSVPEALNTLMRQTDGTAYYVDGSGTRHWIPSGGVFLCFYEWKGLSLYDNLSSDRTGAFAEGSVATCSVPEASNTLLRQSDGTSFFVDGNGTRHWIPTGGVFLCFYEWKGLPLYDNLSAQQTGAFADGATATCSIPEANNTLLRGRDGTSYFVDSGGTRHWIPTGGVFLCFYAWKGLPLYEGLTGDQIAAFAEGSSASCSVPEALYTVIRETTTGTAYFVDGRGTRHWIQDGSTYNCLIKTYPLYHDLTWDHINTFAEGGWQPRSRC